MAEFRVDPDVRLADLAKRSHAGTIGHVVLFAVASIVLGPEITWVHGLAWVAFSALIVVRLLGATAGSYRTGSIALRTSLVAIGAIGTNALWSIAIATTHCTVHDARSSVLAAFITCGIASGTVSALAPSAWIQRGALATLLVPTTILGVFGIADTGGIGAGLSAALHGSYLLFMTAQGIAAGREYREAAERTDQLRHQAADAAATAKQLRGEMQHRAKVEQELRQAQKLEAIGRIAAGIAHEINTPIQFISDNCEFLELGIADLRNGLDAYRRLVHDAGLLAAAEQIEADRDLAFTLANLPEALASSQEGVRRVAQIVQATKQFAHPDQVQKVPTDLNAAVDSTLVVASSETRYISEVRFDHGELPKVPAHGGEIKQVLLNLITNAAHAIGDANRGTSRVGEIRIKTWASNRGVHVSVGDTGPGIPRELVDKIFEPFFTTKPVGKGSGQGLAIARAIIVDKHGGTIDVDSVVGTGSTFTIMLPFDVLSN
ncbi:MAG TPA: ATP-binding protein [Kofleriaceae bacterium]|jgi:signal transduction histidine kinase|nr:ATP-binding protein [Kofleriaceae bacterium]